MVIYIAPQLPYMSPEWRCRHSQEPAYNLGCSRSPRSRTLACSHTAVLIPNLPFNGLYFHNAYKYMYYYLFIDPGGMEGWIGRVYWPIAGSSPAKWSSVNHRSGAEQGKSASAKDRRPNHGCAANSWGNSCAEVIYKCVFRLVYNVILIKLAVICKFVGCLGAKAA